jgi:NAD(P)-dependent dehydrogenase (short-subunit alcohol dehydrogenase family)
MGAEVARVLSQAGCRVILSYRKSRAEAERIVQTIQQSGGEALALRCDLSKPRDVKQAAVSAYRAYGDLSIVVNLSSMYEPGKWEKHWEQNTRAAHLLTDAVVPFLNRSGGGRIIHIGDWTSASGRPRYREFSGYYVSKAAIQALVESSALELAPSILVNAIAPGPMIAPKGMSKAEYREVVQATPLKRWGGAVEIAKAVRFLCETDFVTGETIRVDGGRHLS